MKNKKQKPEVRREQILNAAIDVAKDVGYNNIQRADVAVQAICGTGTINHYFGTMTQLKRAVMRHAIITRCDEIIMQGIAGNDPQVAKLSADVKREVCSTAFNS